MLGNQIHYDNKNESNILETTSDSNIMNNPPLEEFEPIHILLGDLGCVVSFNRMCSLEHRIVLDLPWFELYNPRIYWRRQEIRCPPKRNIQGLNLGCFS